MFVPLAANSALMGLSGGGRDQKIPHGELLKPSVNRVQKTTSQRRTMGELPYWGETEEIVCRICDSIKSPVDGRWCGPVGDGVIPIPAICPRCKEKTANVE